MVDTNSFLTIKTIYSDYIRRKENINQNRNQKYNQNNKMNIYTFSQHSQNSFFLKLKEIIQIRNIQTIKTIYYNYIR